MTFKWDSLEEVNNTTERENERLYWRRNKRKY